MIPITDDQAEYALRIEKQLKAVGARAKADLGSDRMNAKIRSAQKMQVPYMLVVGNEELENQTVSLRKRDGSKQNDLPVSEFAEMIMEKIALRSTEI